ncbi:hypothetical protein TNCV_70981 [Trichonephila clavipes]|nr:hypothetical protein TNCV_70981 [Trichonephila clavipes]
MVAIYYHLTFTKFLLTYDLCRSPGDKGEANFLNELIHELRLTPTCDKISNQNTGSYLFYLLTLTFVICRVSIAVPRNLPDNLNWPTPICDKAANGNQVK